MNKIRVFWFRYMKGHGNFGDELNPYIIEKLSGKKVEYINISAESYKLNWKERTHKILYGENGVQRLKRWLKGDLSINFPVIVGIGSIIRLYQRENVIVWGSGIMSGNDTISKANFLAVRGKYTQERLKELGMKPPSVIGDPGILLPIVYSAKTQKKKYKIGIIPHYVHFELVKSILTDNEVIVINLLGPIEEIADQINSCDLTLSTSLHGIIVSHAYGVPSRWVSFEETAEQRIGGDDIKFRDYFSSVNLPEMEVLDMGAFDTSNLMEIAKEEYIRKPEEFLPVADTIKSVQRDLLCVAPFPLKIEFRNED